MGVPPNADTTSSMTTSAETGREVESVTTASAGTKRPSSEMEQDTAALAGGTADSRTSTKKAKIDREREAVATKATGDNGGDWQTIRNGKATKKAKKVPKKDSGNYPGFTLGRNVRLQSKIQVSDLRNLVTYIFADGPAPQWVAVNHRPAFRKIVAIMVPGLEEAMFRADTDLECWAAAEDGGLDALERWSAAANAAQAKKADDYTPWALAKERLPTPLQPLADVFPLLWPVRARGNDKLGTMFSPVATFLTAPLPKAGDDEEKKKKREQYRPHKDVRTRVTEFLASTEEYLSNNFVLHPAMLPDAAQRAAFQDEPGWVHTAVETLDDGAVPEGAIQQGSITAGRTLYAVDCEMCKAAGDVFVLTRISVLSWDGDVVMDELVKPDAPIVDYLTQYSGITAEMLEPVTTTLRDIQARLLALLDARAILVGHSLDSDLRALQLTHPFIVDTSIAFPHPAGPPKKHALRWLSSKYLNREIQKGHGTARGHDSIEDARTCLDLIKKKCEKGKLWAAGYTGEWAGGEGAGENLFHRLARAGTAYRSQGGPAATGGVSAGKSSAAVDWGDAKRTLCSEAGILLDGCCSDSEVEAAVVRAVRGDPDGAVVPGDGVEFVYARMRGLEALRGWWNRNKMAGSPANDSHGPPSLERLRKAMDEEEANTGEKSEAAGDLARCLGLLAHRIRRIHDQLPPCTALLVMSGSGDPRAMSMLQAQRAQHKREYHTPGVKWDQISVPWTDTEEQQLRRAIRRARDGVGFLTVK